MLRLALAHSKSPPVIPEFLLDVQAERLLLFRAARERL